MHPTAVMHPTLILGIGNLLLRDEGVGIHVVRALQQREVPPAVEVLDGGTSGADLVDAIAHRELLIVVDAMEDAAPAGTVRRLSGEAIDRSAGPALSLHELGLFETLATAAALSCSPRRVVIYGVQPADVSTGLELSPTVRATVDDVVERVLEEARAAAPDQRGTEPARYRTSAVPNQRQGARRRLRSESPILPASDAPAHSRHEKRE